MAHFTFYLTIFLSLTGCLSSTSEDFPTLLLGNRVNIQLMQSSQAKNMELIMDDIKYSTSCDYIFSDNLIFWMDAAGDGSGQGKIQCTYTNVTFKERVKHNVIHTGLVNPQGLACDWIGKKLYWTDADTNRIEVSDLKGKMRKVLIWDQIDLPRAIAVDPMRGYMYWTDWGDNPKIERAGMDGTNRQILVERDGVYWPNGLTLDYDEGKVYWVDANYHYINRMNMDGTGREVVVSNGPSNAGDNAGNWDHVTGTQGGALQYPYAITLSGNKIYWTDLATNLIHSAAKNGSGQTAVVNENISSLVDIHSYGAHRQKKGTNPCGNNNGGCSHLCLLSPTPPSFSCACPTGVQIKADGKTCKDGPESILLLARRPDLRVISLDTPDFTDNVLPLENVKTAVAVEYDPVDNMVYWSNNMKKAIFRAKLTGEDEEKIISDEIEQCDGMAVDWVARNLYWTEAGRNYIAVSRLNGTFRKTLIENGVEDPRAIVLDPAEGQMYWSDWGDPAKIERSSLDGTDRVVFVNTSIMWPNGLAIDYNKRVLYWAEAYLNKIEVIGLDGSGRRVLLEERIPHIFGFSLLDDYLYWSDWQKREVERMLVNNLDSRQCMIDELSDLMGLKASRVDPIPATNPCAKNNGGCTHLCLYTPKGASCHCPDGQELLKDMRSCIEPEAFLLFSLSSEGVGRISLETAPRSSVVVPFDNRVDAIHLDVSVEEDAIYWTDHEQKQIFRSYMNGTGVRSVIDQGPSELEGIAIDWLGQNLYWANSRTNRIEMARLDSTSRRPVIWQGLDTPFSVAVDPINGYVYWSEWGGGKPKIRRAEMDGSKVETLVGDGEIGRASSLTIDYEKRRLYWVDMDVNEIRSSNMTGGNQIQIVSGTDKPILAMTLYKDFVYWTKSNSIERANKTTGENRILIQSGADITAGDQTIHDMLVYHKSRQSGVSACSHDNGGCQHICLSVPGGKHKCACPAHHKLQKDNSTCSAPKHFLLFSQERYISRVVFERGMGGRQSPDAVLPIRGLLNACAIDYDPLDDFIFWIDCALGEIKKSRMNGTESTTLLANKDGLAQPYDLAVDAYGRMLYWTDASNDSINIMKLDGNIIGAIAERKVKLVGTGNINEEIDIMPRKIALYPKNGYLFFSNECEDDDQMCRVMIVRMALDGKECLVLFNKGIKKVSGLAVDQDAAKLYWADEELRKIDSSNLDGSSHAPFCDTNLIQPGGVTIFGLNVYWIDKKDDGWQIETDRKTGGHHKIIQGRIQNLMDIVGVVEINKRELANHPCKLKDKDFCSHMCVSKDDGTSRCSCPKHLTLINENDCDEAPTCKPSDFKCVSGDDVPCIPGKWRCDNEEDCDDGSDEKNCPVCQAKDSFWCGTGVGGAAGEMARATDQISKFYGLGPNLDLDQCLPMSVRCNGKTDCLDGSDELHCYAECNPNEFICDKVKCMPESARCNRKDDCLDQTDEQGCQDMTPQTHSDSTIIIVIISIASSAIIIAVIIFNCKKRKSRNNQPYQSGTVTFTGCGDLRLNLEVMSHGDHLTQVNHQGGQASHPLKPAKKGNGGRSTASLNVSIVQPSGATHMVNGHMPPAHNRPMLPGPHPSYGTMPYPSSYDVNDHMILPTDPQFHERPNVPGASSSSSSTRTNNQFLPTLNPPPSPATDRSGSKSTGECQYSSDSPSNRTTSYYRCRNGHRHRRSHHHRVHTQAPPPPTPCTSDTCDDFMSYHSGASGREFDTISRRSKSGGAPSSPPPPYCPCYHHYYHPYLGYGGGYHPYPPPSSYHSSHHGYHTPPLGPGDHHQHSSSSSGSTRLAPPECPGPCCHTGSGRHHHYSGRSVRGSRHPPPRYNVMSSDLNSDSDPFAPPPTPRSYYMSDCCYTHDEADDNQDDETGSDPTRFVNQVEEVADMGEDPDLDTKDSDPLIPEGPLSGEDPSPDQDLGTPPEVLCEKDIDPAPEVEMGVEGKPEETEESASLLSQGQPRPADPTNTQQGFDQPYIQPLIFNPPPSPVTDSS